MLTRNLLVASLVLNVALAAAAMFFHLDNNSLQEQRQALSDARDQVIAETKTLELNAQAMQKKLNALTQAAALPEDESKERLLKDIAMKDEMIAALRQELDNSSASRQSQNQGQRPERRQRDTPRESIEERMERIRTENPERYEQMMTRRREMEERIAKRDDFLNAIDVSKLPAAKRQAVTEYRELLRANQELMQSAVQGDRTSGREMWENQRAINDLSAEVRTILLEQYGKSIGAGGAQLADQVNQILDATSTGFGGGGFGGQGRRR
ncbi:MAG TPA: hypothetical protein PKY10_10965 [Lentisphaeria bacterium]|nr:hypothetical protein [Lentisphaeria bacterium]